ncbi:hypothetical protein BB737_14900, partial [Mycobacterium avium subsp. hominissuis]
MRGLLSLRRIGREDRLSLHAIDADAVRLAELYEEGPHPGFGLIALVTAAGPLYERAESIAAKYSR